MQTASKTPIRIFGYGSLISKHSLLSTVPDAKNITPAYIKGFRRDFSLWDPEGWTQSELDLAGVPFCAVDVAKSNDGEVNGITFEMSHDNFVALKRREQEYGLLETIAYDFKSNKPLGNCWIFHANKQNGSYAFNEPAQNRYLEIIFKASKEYGDSFYAKFLETTYIDGIPLSQMPDLVQSIHSEL